MEQSEVRDGQPGQRLPPEEERSHVARPPFLHTHAVITAFWGVTFLVMTVSQPTAPA